jgi:hypothetical protein
MGRSKCIAVRVCCIFLSFGLFLLLLEAILAIVRINTKSDVRFVPGMEGTYIPHAYYRHTKEGFSEGYFNSHGFRDYERSYAKPPGSFRILVLGDSYVEALQVALENSFPALLEKKLNENSTSIKFEVLNLGQSGFGTADEYMRYLHFGISYRPDLVILAFLTGNDIRNNSKTLNRGQFGFYFSLDKNGNLVLDRSVIDDYEKSLTLPKRVFQLTKEHSYLASLISERLYLLRLQFQQQRFENLEAAEEHHKAEREALDELSDLNVYFPDMSNRWKEAFAITKALLGKLRQAVEGNGGRFLLVTLSNAPQVDPQVQERLKSEYGLPFDFEQPDRIIEEFAQGEQITYLKLMPVFRDYHLRTGRNLHGFGVVESGHWNESGHLLAAETIFQFLKQKHLVPLGDAGFNKRASNS